MNRVDVNGFANGHLQVFCEGAWGAVCSSNFDDLDALVACRQLGFTTGFAQRLPRFSNRIESDPVRRQNFYTQWIRELAMVSRGLAAVCLGVSLGRKPTPQVARAIAPIAHRNFGCQAWLHMAMLSFKMQKCAEWTTMSHA